MSALLDDNALPEYTHPGRKVPIAHMCDSSQVIIPYFEYWSFRVNSLVPGSNNTSPNTPVPPPLLHLR